MVVAHLQDPFAEVRIENPSEVCRDTHSHQRREHYTSPGSVKRVPDVQTHGRCVRPCVHGDHKSIAKRPQRFVRASTTLEAELPFEQPDTGDGHVAFHSGCQQELKDLK